MGSGTHGGVEQAPAGAGAIRMTPAVRDAILEHARGASPEECCGLLLGGEGGIRGVHPARNDSSDPRRRYRIDPADHFAAVRRARAAGLRVIGGYHSHPRHAAEPSPVDRAEADDPDWLHVIASPAEGIVRAWRLSDGNFHELPIVPCG